MQHACPLHNMKSNYTICIVLLPSLCTYSLANSNNIYMTTDGYLDVINIRTNL